MGLLQTTLDEIKAKHSNDPSECLTDMLSQWLKRGDSVNINGEPTWEVLAIALNNMGYTAAYHKIIEQKVK